MPFADGGGTCLIVTRQQESDDDARETVQAIQRGEIDAVVVSETADDPKVLLLGAAGRRYRLLVEQMRDGAATLSSDGDVLYSNPQIRRNARRIAKRDRRHAAGRLSRGP